jgi:hypothetical protein
MNNGERRQTTGKRPGAVDNRAKREKCDLASGSELIQIKEAIDRAVQIDGR